MIKHWRYCQILSNLTRINAMFLESLIILSMYIFSKTTHFEELVGEMNYYTYLNFPNKSKLKTKRL